MEDTMDKTSKLVERLKHTESPWNRRRSSYDYDCERCGGSVSLVDSTTSLMSQITVRICFDCRRAFDLDNTVRALNVDIHRFVIRREAFIRVGLADKAEEAFLTQINFENSARDYVVHWLADPSAKKVVDPEDEVHDGDR